MITKTEWLSLKLYSEEICQVVSRLDSVGDLFLEAQLALELDSLTGQLKILILQLRGQICQSPKTSFHQECLT